MGANCTLAFFIKFLPAIIHKRSDNCNHPYLSPGVGHAPLLAVVGNKTLIHKKKISPKKTALEYTKVIAYISSTQLPFSTLAYCISYNKFYNHSLWPLAIKKNKW